MTDAELREIKAKHFPAGIWGCRKCGLTPADAQCEAQELLAEVERLRGVVAKGEVRITSAAGTLRMVRSEMYMAGVRDRPIVMLDMAAAELRAALAELEGKV